MMFSIPFALFFGLVILGIVILFIEHVADRLGIPKLG